MPPKRGSKDSEFHLARESLMSSLNRSKDYVAKICLSMVAAELETRLSLVESSFSQLCSVQQHIEKSCEDAGDFKTRHEIEDIYCEVKAKILTQLIQWGRHSTLSVPVATSRSAKLPKFKLPEFNGKFTEWTSWFNTFSTLIESDTDVDEL